jgi:hypothetical protein
METAEILTSSVSCEILFELIVMDEIWPLSESKKKNTDNNERYAYNNPTFRANLFQVCKEPLKLTQTQAYDFDRNLLNAQNPGKSIGGRS